MSTPQSDITHVGDTALLVAAARAAESERPDAFIHDPFAARLAGERGVAMYHALSRPEIMGFGMAIRTKFIDELLFDTLSSSTVATVVSLGCGLDSRPWRLALPPHLRWIEVDFPDMLDYKESVLASETPTCRRERLNADITDPAQRRAFYQAIGPAPALLITEGLLMYLPAATVDSLAAESGRESGIAHWICDITSSTFSKILTSEGLLNVRHVQADDFLEGEQILETVYRHGWTASARRSYITDMAFASARLVQMAAGAPQPPSPPPYSPDDPTGVHRFARI